jgi:hypothetical protein
MRPVDAVTRLVNDRFPEALAAFLGGTGPLRTVAYQVLDRAGGRLMEGYHRQAT